MKILLATDGSDASLNAAAEVAKRPWPDGTSVRVVSVEEPPTVYATEIWAAPADLYDRIEEAERAQAERAVRAALGVLREKAVSPVEATGEVLRGVPRQALVDAAAAEGADLVVLGSHGRGFFGRLLLGSTAAFVATHAPCSVELVRHRPAKSPANEGFQ